MNSKQKYELGRRIAKLLNECQELNTKRQEQGLTEFEQDSLYAKRYEYKMFLDRLEKSLDTEEMAEFFIDRGLSDLEDEELKEDEENEI